jgi:hypothetical protein
VSYTVCPVHAWDDADVVVGATCNRQARQPHALIRSLVSKGAPVFRQAAAPSTYGEPFAALSIFDVNKAATLDYLDGMFDTMSESEFTIFAELTGVFTDV